MVRGVRPQASMCMYMHMDNYMSVLHDSTISS